MMPSRLRTFTGVWRDRNQNVKGHSDRLCLEKSMIFQKFQGFSSFFFANQVAVSENGFWKIVLLVNFCVMTKSGMTGKVG